MTTHSEELIMMFVANDPELITGVLFSTGFIQDDALLKLAGDDTPNGKAALLVEAVRKEIELAPKKFTEFLEILSENFLPVDVVDGLLATYQCEFSVNAKLYGLSVIIRWDELYHHKRVIVGLCSNLRSLRLCRLECGARSAHFVYCIVSEI